MIKIKRQNGRRKVRWAAALAALILALQLAGCSKGTGEGAGGGKSVAAGFMKSNPYKDKGFVPGQYSEENYDKIDLCLLYTSRCV